MSRSRPLGVDRRRPLGGAANALILAALGGAFVLAYRWQEQSGRVEQTTRDAAALATDLPEHGRDGGYVSSARCRACHPSEHASWHASYHRSMTQVASKESVLADFDGSTIECNGVDYRVYERGGKFFAEMPDPDAMMDVVQMRGQDAMAAKLPRVERRVVMTTGSHHYQTYWVAGDDEYGRLLQTLPLVYLRKDDRWIPRPQAFMRPPGDRFLTQWNHHCIKCHSTGGIPGVVDNGRRGAFDTRVADLGIACEACHGPGERHVAANANPARRYWLHTTGAVDDTIVNPARLDHERSSHVCGQCHGVFIAKNDKHGMEYARSGESYRPGDSLYDSRHYIQHPAGGDDPKRLAEFQDNPEFFRQRWWDDGSILAGGREFTAMSDSACYLRGEMSCLSCHSMHNSDPDAQLTRGLADQSMCTQCHKQPQYTSNVAEHTHHAAASSGSDCLNCHMPHNSYALFAAVRSHRIASPSAAASLEHGTPNACNLCHLDKTLDWTQKNLVAWFGHKPVAVTDEQRDTSAAILWLLKGHAAQRAIVAWNAGWAPAREASGDRWIAPFVARLLSDPYGVVRYVAHDTLRRLPGPTSSKSAVSDFAYDFLGDSAYLADRAERAIQRWTSDDLQPNAPALVTDDGRIDRRRFDQLYSERDDRPIVISE
ncbi:MAG: cytochrome c3 family protein [Lacipirellulaceae bacterium]